MSSRREKAKGWFSEASQDGRRRWLKTGIRILFGVTLLLMAGSAFATGTGDSLPWDTFIGKLASNLQGKIGPAAVVIALILAGAMWAFSRNMQAVKGVAIVLIAGTILLGGSQWIAATGFSASLV